MPGTENSSLSEQQGSDNPQACCPSIAARRHCSSDSRGVLRKWKALIFFTALVTAGAVLAHSLIKMSDAATEPALWGPELNSLAALDEVATDIDVVFILICSQDQQDAEAIIGEIEGAIENIRSNGRRASAFKLKNGTTDYKNLAQQFSVPTVLAMVKGFGYSAVSERITEAGLLGAFATASIAPPACCPPGTDPSLCGPGGLVPADPE